MNRPTYLATILGLVIAGAISMLPAATRAQYGPALPPDNQTFTPDAEQCVDGTDNMTANEPGSPWPVLGACTGEDLTLGAEVDLEWSVRVTLGQRAPTITYYTTGGAVTLGTSIPDDTLIGSLKMAGDVHCDGDQDIYADLSNTPPITFSTAVADQLLERTTTFTATSGPGGTSELYLSKMLPPFTNVVRTRATVDGVYLNGGAQLLNVLPENYREVNVVTQVPPFAPTLAVSHFVFGQGAVAPSTEIGSCAVPLTVQLESLGYVFNPTVAGLYARWATMLSTPGVIDPTAQTFVYTTHCKQFGGVVVTDADNDCRADTVDADPADADRDNDGLLDGIEFAWGTSPTVADTDGDGRTDAEEMVGPPQFLTNPLLADTDSDGLADAGYVLDCDNDGTPDNISYESGPSGRNRVTMQVVFCGGGAGPLGGQPFGNPGAASADNCPDTANPLQENSATADYANDKIAGTADVTQVNGRFMGDACVSDADNDAVPDEIEDGLIGSGFGWDPTKTGQDEHPCSTGPGAAYQFGAGDADGDGTNARNDPDIDNDGTNDGVECKLGSSPGDATSKDLAPLPQDMAAYFRARALVLGLGIVDDDLDQDAALSAGQLGGSSDYNTDGDGICPLTGTPDSLGQPTCGALVAPQGRVGDGLTTRGDIGAAGVGAPATVDIDRDGCADAVERGDFNGDSVANAGDKLQLDRAIAGVLAWAPPATLTPLEQATMDFNGDGNGNSSDQLTLARVIAGSYGALNLNCRATVTGIAAN